MPVEPNWAWDPAVGHPLIHAQEAPANEDSDENTALAPLSFSAYLWRGPFTAHVHCCIPAYAGMAIGDRITVRWGDEKFDLSPLYSGDVGRAVLAAVPTHALEPIRAGIAWNSATARSVPMAIARAGPPVPARGTRSWPRGALCTQPRLSGLSSAALPSNTGPAMKLDPHDLQQITATTLNNYQQVAEDFRHGTRDHDVSQNIEALLRHLQGPAPWQILDFGCGPGRDLQNFTRLGHVAVGLDGTERFAEMARADSGCEVWHQDFLQLDLPAERFDGIFANASLFHVPSQELPRVLRELWATLKPGGALFSSNPAATIKKAGKASATAPTTTWKAGARC